MESRLIEFLKAHRPAILEEFDRYVNADKLPVKGTKVLTLRPGFGGLSGQTRYVAGYNLLSTKQTSDTYENINDVNYIVLDHGPWQGQKGNNSTYCLSVDTWWKDVKILEEPNK